MRIRLVLDDKEYGHVLAQAVARSGRDTYLELGNDFRADGDTLIVTDRHYRGIGADMVKKRRGGIVFMLRSPVPDKLRERSRGPFFLFKYDSVDKIIAGFHISYSRWKGESCISGKGAAKVSIFCDGDEKIQSRIAYGVARQIAYKTGKSVLLLPLTFVNSYRHDGGEDRKDLVRMFYNISEGRILPREAFFYKDTYDVEHIRMPCGLNYLLELGYDAVNSIIDFISTKYFDVIVFEIGSAFTEIAKKVIIGSDYPVFVSSAKVDAFIASAFGNELNGLISIDGGSLEDGELRADDIAAMVAEGCRHE